MNPLDVSAAAPVRGLPDPAGAALDLMVPAGKRADSIAPLLQQLASLPIQNLLGSIEQHWSHEPARVASLREAALTAYSQRDLPAAFHALTELARIHPDAVEHFLRAEPGQADAEMPAELKGMVEHIIVTAKARAEASLSVAARAVAVGVPRAAEFNPIEVLGVAQQFFDAGRYVNYVRAAHMCQAIAVLYDVPRASRNRQREAAVRAIETIAGLWRRVPMLVLMAAWFLAGLAGGLCFRMLGAERVASSAFEVWGAGFLALVGLQFYLTIRNARW